MVETKTQSPLQRLYADIKGLDDLSPSPTVNKAFGELVPVAIDPKTPLDLNQNQVSFLQQACAKAETLLEKEWSRDIVRADNPQAKLEQFPYMQNYYDLSELEIRIINQFSPDLRGSGITFVGGGLPLTPYVLAKRFGIQSVVLDNDPEAAELAEKFVYSVGLKDKLKVVCTGGERFSGYGALTFVAALAGVDEQIKIHILSQIRNIAPTGSHILARSIEEKTAREVLYAPLPNQVDQMFRKLTLVHPSQTPGFEQVVNSVAFYQIEKDAA